MYFMLEIVENKKEKIFKKNLNKTFMAKATGPFRDSQAPSWLSGPRTDVPPLIEPGNAM